MHTNDDFEKAKQFYKNKEYRNAITLYKQLWKNKQQFTNQHKYFFAWSLYHHYIKNNHINNQDRFNAAHLIVQLVTQNNCNNSNYPCVYTRTVLSIIKILKQEKQSNEMLNWLHKLNPELLRSKPFTGNNGKLPSDKELWYLNYTNALYNTQKYNECIALASKALNNISFTNNNDVWIRRRLALSLCYEKNYQEAIVQFKEILKKKKDWFILFELAKTYYKNNEIDLSFEYCLKAINDTKHSEKLINVYILLGDILAAKNNLDYAIMHYQLAYRIMIDNGWSVRKVEPYIRKYNIDRTSTPQKKDLLKTLQPIWNTLQYQNKPVYYGKIQKILPSGNGFIAAEDNHSYFFSKNSFIDQHIQLKENLRVSFHLEDGYDSKKNRETTVAVNIKVIPQ